MYWPQDGPHVNAAGKTIKRRKPEFVFNIGDKVRLAVIKKAFEREYSVKWSTELFIIRDRFISQRQAKYKLKKWNGEDIGGSYYRSELQKTNGPVEWKIDKILDTRGRGRNKEVLVSWRGWSEEYNSWIPAQNVVDI